ncbi:Arc family DNA-binding protein [Hydrogenophaga sp. SNF1]|uniref:Arc family DNA-binding protein n=1 Tax=Hydrogenophaga sp. SNF1 TaxID=3098762 RepID=UPI002ACC013C|nr:Arc family DNA-binding protein [Hydrogenophaga sp. SNF1]WQB84874.1 Arc family DNA-binding protein [Hydrogenophaga sp. SNF1]
MARTDPTIYMRIPEGLKEALDRAAEENKRSLTAEVVARLEQSFSSVGIGDAREDATTTVINRLAALEEQLAARSRDEAELRLRHMQQSLATQELVFRDRVERGHAHVQRLEAEADQAEDRGDLVAAKRLRTKASEDRKSVREIEEELHTIRLEIAKAREDIKSIASSETPKRRRVKINWPEE